MTERVSPSLAPERGEVHFASSLVGGLRLPADKSVAHRALLFNAMAGGEADVTMPQPFGLDHRDDRLDHVEGELDADPVSVRAPLVDPDMQPAVAGMGSAGEQQHGEDQA